MENHTSGKINHWMDHVIEMAKENVRQGEGPFAAIIVRHDEIVGTGVNSVGSSQDPTAHAELLAVQDACQRLNTVDLSDCQLYASGEPCPMCMGAIYWAKLGAVYYACSKQEANDAVAFTDPLHHFYKDMLRPLADRSIPMQHIHSPKKLEPFNLWAERQ